MTEGMTAGSSVEVAAVPPSAGSRWERGEATSRSESRGGIEPVASRGKRTSAQRLGKLVA
jgi:hypothetical protein